MDMNSVNFFVVALSCTLLFVVGQRGDSPVEEKQSVCAMNMDDLKKQTGTAATSQFLSADEAKKQDPPKSTRSARNADNPDDCQKTCQWQLLNFALVGADGLYYTPVTGLGFGGALLYQSIYACKCSEPGNTCGGQCYSLPQSDPWRHCDFFQQTWLPTQCACPVRTCEHSYSWHFTLVWPNFPEVNSCYPPVWQNVKIPTGCCCEVKAYSLPTGPIFGK